jgi:hypothetical protein
MVHTPLLRDFNGSVRYFLFALSADGGSDRRSRTPAPSRGSFPRAGWPVDAFSAELGAGRREEAAA